MVQVKKIFWGEFMTIGEISKKTNLSASTLRYYEKKNLIRVARDKNGLRNYSENDVEWIKFIRRLKETGMILKEIQKYSDLRYQGESTMAERLKILKKHREYVLAKQHEWQGYLKNLDDKIKIYEQSIKIFLT